MDKTQSQATEKYHQSTNVSDSSATADYVPWSAAD